MFTVCYTLCLEYEDTQRLVMAKTTSLVMPSKSSGSATANFSKVFWAPIQSAPALSCFSALWLTQRYLSKSSKDQKDSFWDIFLRLRQAVRIDF